MLVDLAFLTVIVIFTVKYFRRGLAVSLLRGLGVISSVSVSLLFGGRLSEYFGRFIDVDLVSEAVSMLITRFICGALAYSSLFSSSYLLFLFLIKRVNLARRPILGRIDKCLGALFGFSIGTVVSFLAIFAVYSAIIAVNSLLGVGDGLLYQFDQAKIFKYVYNSGSQIAFSVLL